MEQHEKVFFEVFPDFHCPEDISGMFNHVIVKDVILSKANKELGWKAQRTIEETLKAAWTWELFIAHK